LIVSWCSGEIRSRSDRANFDAAIVRLYRHDGPLWALLLISLMVGRKSEVFRLTLRDVVVTTGEGAPARLLLTILAGKGDKLLRQSVPLDSYPSDMVEDICRHLRGRFAVEGAGAELFAPLALQGGIPQVVDLVATRLSEIGWAWHPHSTRHAFVTALAGAGHDLAEISERMGHVGVDTTLGYVDFDPTSIAIDEAHHQEMLGGELSVAGIMVLRGVGRRRAEQLRACGLRSPRQLLTAPPR